MKRSYLVGFGIVLFLFTFAGSCSNFKIERNGKTYGAAVCVTFEDFEKKKDPDLPVPLASGVNLVVAVKPEEGSNLKELCPNGQLVWRQWIKSTKWWMGKGKVHDENTWYRDGPSSSNPDIPNERLTREDRTNGYEYKFADTPRRGSRHARDGDVTIDFVTCFGCSTNGTFKPLVCFTWGWTQDEDGDVSRDGLDELKTEDFNKMKLP